MNSPVPLLIAMITVVVIGLLAPLAVGSVLTR